MDREGRNSRERPESQIDCVAAVTENMANMSPPTTFGRSMRLHLDDVRFDDSDSSDFCTSEAITRGQAEELIASHSSKFPRGHLPSSFVNCSGSRSEAHSHRPASHNHHQNGYCESPIGADIQLQEGNEPALDSFLRRAPSSEIDAVRHRSASPTHRKVSIASAPGMGEPRPPMRHRSESPMRRGVSLAACGGSAAVNAARDQKVYKAQVAAALNTGRSVWL
jgi:hypothetical protein